MLEENQKLKTENESLQQRIKSGAIANGVANGINGKTVQQQIAEFDNMKKSLMRDLQNRCERVSGPSRLSIADVVLINYRLSSLKSP
jgi:kinesin family protein 5